ncbi:MAG: DEAD/DEAH box helicase [Methanoregulaceae archaeon]
MTRDMVRSSGGVRHFHPANPKAITPSHQSSSHMPSAFRELHGTLQQVLVQQMGWNELREVQEAAFGPISRGQSVLVTAPTAGGKSEAALIPILDGILKNGYPGVACLYLSPLKALINDQEERLVTLCTPAGFSVRKWHGDVPKGSRFWKEGEPPHILLITPESLEVLLMEGGITPDLANLRYILVDEVHAFADTERGAQLLCLLDRLDRLAGRTIQRIGLSATVGNPGEILDWFTGDTREKEIVSVPAPPREKRFTFTVEPDEDRRMAAIARIVAGKKALVFVNSRSDAERIAKALKGVVRNLSVHHSSLSPELRKAAEEVITGPEGGCIICTSTLELGIDIGDLDVAVQIGPPNSVSSFLQRMGRTGRRSRAAYVAWVLENPMDMLFSAAILICAAQRRVEPLTPPKFPYSVLLQQMLVIIQKGGRISRRYLAREVLPLTPFRTVGQETFDALLNHLVREGYFVTDGDMLMTGTRAETEFGRSNWKDIYSVIPGGGEYRAVTPDGDVVGTLDARFVGSRGAQDFSLGGSNWQVVKCDEDRNVVVVVPGSGQKSRVFWTGGEVGFSLLICDAVLQIVAAGEAGLPFGEKDRELLHAAIAALPKGLCHGRLHVSSEKSSGTSSDKTAGAEETRILTFRGRRFNRILCALVSHELEGTVQAGYDDIVVTLRGKRKGAGNPDLVRAILERILTFGPDEIESALEAPPREGWKFATMLPGPMFREMVMTDYYGVSEFRNAMEYLTLAESLRNPGVSGSELPEDPEDTYDSENDTP